MKLTVTTVDYNPPELSEQVPFSFAIIRMLPGLDRPDYWLGQLDEPLRWIDDDHERSVDYVVVSARWQGTQIEPHMSNTPIGIAYVTDPSQIAEPSLSFDKCKYVAIGIASEVEGTNPPAGLASIISGRIARAFGKGS
jgi:hypothetical protein